MFSKLMSRVTIDRGFGKITTNTLVITSDGSVFVIRTSLSTKDIKRSLAKILMASPEAQRFVEETGYTINPAIVGSVDQTNPSAKVSSGIQNPGGIDFRVIPTKLMGNFSGLNFNLPQLSKSQLERINVGTELNQLNSMVSSGIRPSDQRITEVVAACIQKKQVNQYLDKIVAVTMNICNSEAFKAVKTSDGLKRIMIALDSVNY